MINQQVMHKIFALRLPYYLSLLLIFVYMRCPHMCLILTYIGTDDIGSGTDDKIDPTGNA